MTIRKSLKKSSKCRQAEFSSSICLDFRAKQVKTFTSTKNRKYAKKWGEKYWPVFLVACTRLYNPLRRSVGRSVGPSVRPSVRPSIRPSVRPSVRPCPPALVRLSVSPSTCPLIEDNQQYVYRLNPYQVSLFHITKIHTKICIYVDLTSFLPPPQFLLGGLVNLRKC